MTEVKYSPDLSPEPGNGGGDAADLPMADAESDSDSGSDNDDQLNLDIENLEAEVSNNPSNYEAHVQYIQALRKQGNIEKLRKAREAMSLLFPLSPDLWREWARDETAVDSRPEVLPAIEKLYEQGVSDYLFVPLWLEYADFLQEYDPAVRACSATGVSKVRDLFERAVAAAGLHFVQGGRIYEAYREFEQAILLTFAEADTESKEKQVQRVRSIFFRQLSVPHLDLEKTLLTYKAWEAEQGSNIDADSDGLPAHVASAYEKALEMLKARDHFEEEISKKEYSDSERLQQFMTYLKFEKSSGDPTRVRVLFERAITEFPICTDLWLDYTSYLDKTLKTSSIVKDVYSRSIRNCAWVGELWTRYLLHLERVHACDEELLTVFEKSLQCTFSSYDEYLDLFLTRVDGLRRRISFTCVTDGSSTFSLIRETFQRASDYLAPSLKNTESLLRLYRYWANLELSLGNGVVAARAVWESFLKISGSMLEALQCYVDFEIRAGHIAEARSLYKRCYGKRFSGTGSEDICHAWLRFEREYGSLEDLDIAVQKVTPRMEELQLFKMQQESKAGLHKLQENSVKNIVREKRKLQSTSGDDMSSAKRHKEATVESKRPKERRKNKAADSGGNNVALTGAQTHTDKNGSGTKKEADSVSPGKSKHYNDQCTAFISNLNLRATYENLRAFFSDVGGVVGIRILNDKFTGKSRGLAYVDFCDEEHLAAALAKNKQTMLDKRLSILRSDPKGKRKRAEQSTLPTHGEAEKSSEAEKSIAGDSGSTSTDNSELKPASTSQNHGEGDIKLKRRQPFVPRAVRPLGWTDKSKPAVAPEGAADETPKSNEEFRNMFLKKT